MKTHAEAQSRNPSRPPATPVPNALAHQAQLRQALHRAGVQPQLKIGAVNDPLEREADAAAERVLRMPEPIPPSPASGRGAGGEGKISPAPTTTEASPQLESSLNSLSSGGTSLDASTRAFFEPRFGQDFSQVRLHTDDNAAQMAGSLNAQAFTLGNNIAFAPNQYSAHTSTGKTLLGHELAHVVQQRSMSIAPMQLKPSEYGVDKIQYATAMGATVDEGALRSEVSYDGQTENYTYFPGFEKTEASSMNQRFGWTNSWIPNGKTEAVYIGVHSVSPGYYHSCIIVFAAPKSKFTHSGLRRYNETEQVRYVTLGAGDENGLLISDVNRTNDVNIDIKVQMIKLSSENITAINNLFVCENNYRNSPKKAAYKLLPDWKERVDRSRTITSNGSAVAQSPEAFYALFPQSKIEGYNCNSFTFGLLCAAGILSQKPDYDVPGWDYPLPKYYFFGGKNNKETQ